MHRFLDEFILYEIQNKYSPRTPIFKLCPIALGLQDLNCIGGLLHERKSGTWQIKDLPWAALNNGT